MIRTRPHVISILMELVSLAFIFVGLLIVSVYMLAVAPDEYLAQLLFMVPAILVGGAFIFRYLYWQSTTIAFTHRSVTIRSGIIFRRQRVISVVGTSIDLVQSPTDRLLNIGTIEIHSIHGETTRFGMLMNFQTIRQFFAE